jgi:hypothetical protein
MQYNCRVISNHVGFDVSTSAWLKIALMGCDEPSLGNQLPMLEGTYCLPLYRSRVQKRMPGMSLYRSCTAFFSDLSTNEDARRFSYETSEIDNPVPEERKPQKQLRLMAWFDKTLTLKWIELNGIWVRALPDPMHLGLRTGPLCPIICTKLEEPCSFSEVPDGPYT